MALDRRTRTRRDPADYLHQVFEPTARAIAGLERALAGLGLLDEALRLDLRRPQDYFHRVWSTNFPAADLANADAEDDPDREESALPPHQYGSGRRPRSTPVMPPPQPRSIVRAPHCSR